MRPKMLCEAEIAAAILMGTLFMKGFAAQQERFEGFVPRTMRKNPKPGQRIAMRYEQAASRCHS
jgi:TfoX/Sxy family transcriptional regulator of competence genes